MLKPNPNYGGRRRPRLDAIVVRTGIDPGRAVAAVARGAVDDVPGEDDALAPGSLAARSSGARYHLTANNWTERLALNPARRLFADPRTRRAVALALDRAALAHSLERGAFELPTNAVLPPNFAGPTSGAEALPPVRAASAQRLLDGKRARAVLATWAPATGPVYEAGFVAELRRELATIGIALEVAPLRQDSPPRRVAAVLAGADLALVPGNADDARDAVAFLLHLPYLAATDRAALERVALLPFDRRRATAVALAARLARDDDVIGFANGATAEIVSRRVGCVVRPPEYPGVDLAALCLRGGAR